jgi:MarR family transcriptional regulator, lower aerobic nicotinate degradation pathway regulator
MVTSRARAGTRATPAVPSQPEPDFDPRRLTSSPEYLIRRAHQLAVASFSQACADLGVTPAQYTAMFMLRGHAHVGQNELGRLVALDRSTMSMVVRSLKERGWVKVAADLNDRRKTLLELTNAGRLVLADAEQRSTQAGEQLLSVFDKRQSEQFMALLQRIITASDPDGPAR